MMRRQNKAEWKQEKRRSLPHLKKKQKSPQYLKSEEEMIKSSKKNLTTKNKSVILALKAKNLIDDSLLVCINSLTLEDLISIKLELSANHINNRPYGFDIWRKSSYIIKEALLKFALSTTNSKKDAARFLGLTYSEFKKAIKQYKVTKFFNDENSD